jgi:glutamate/tyrosine decarboxylase-like PLP-dependent enzyme
LVSKLEWCKEQGATAVCVVATAGTTTTGSVDPLRELAQACAEHGVWLHVDAAYGGALVLSRRHRYLLDGVDRADSVTFNPQKWLYVPKTCAMVLFKDAQLWHDSFRVASPYMSSAGDQVNLTEVSVQGTRHAEVLKLWLSLQHIGANLHERLIDRSMALATRLAELLQAVHGIEVLGRPQTNIVCFRVRSSSGGWDDTRTERVREHLLKRAGVFCSMPTYAGGKVLRVVLLNPHTDHRFVEHLAHQVSEAISTLG